MDTATFLRTILPITGTLFIARIKAGKGVFIHTPATSAEEAALIATAQDTQHPNDNVYYAMASYKEVITKTSPNGYEYATGRTQANALNVKCLWQDWDVGKDNSNSYATRQDALASIKTYLAATGLPAPLIVSSGYGLHTYWIFDEEVPAAIWNDIAQYQRIIMRHLGVKFDPSRDKDCASVLRPVGCHNRKAGQEDKQVKVVHAEVNSLPAMETKRILQRYCNANGLSALVTAPVSAIPEWMRGDAGNLDALKPEFAKSYPEIAVQHCKQLAEFSENGGADEWLWYANLGVLKHMEDGQDYAHAWSSAHPEYDSATTQQKYEQWTTGPTTCDKFKELNPTACAGCKHRCKSPVQLGIKEETAPPEMVDDPLAAATNPEFDVKEFWPEKFTYEKGTDCIYTVRPDKEGAPEKVAVATPLFYPVAQLRLDDGTFGFRMHVMIRGKVREFQLPLKSLADPRVLKGLLMANQIQVIHQVATTDFMVGQMHAMRKRKEEIDTYQQMGWHHEGKGFLLGDTLITEQEEIKVVMGTRFKNNGLSTLRKQSGSPDAWVQAVDALYNRPNAEPYQLAVGTAFGNILNGLLGVTNWNGIPLALTSDESGYGKSTVFLLAYSIYCKQDATVVVTDSTPKAIPVRTSAMNHVPFLLDEVTKYLSDPKDASDVLYALSNGGTRGGLTSEGAERERPPNWGSAPSMTGNRNILHHLTENKLNPEAAQMRVFEIDMQAYPRVETMRKGSRDYEAFYAEHSQLAKNVVETNYGVLGVEWVRYVMKHRAEITERLRATAFKMMKFMDGGDATKERYYYHWATCTLVGLYYARKLGYVNFDLTKLAKWTVAHVASMRTTTEEYKDTPEDHFSSMMADMVGKIIVTKRFENLDRRDDKATEYPLVPVNRNPVCGRLALGDAKERAKLYISTKAVTQWCAENGVQYTKLRRDFMREGLIRLGTNGVNKATGVLRVSIGKGVVGFTQIGNPTCFEMDAERAAHVLTDHPVAEVTNLVAVS